MLVCVKETSQGDVSFTHTKRVLMGEEKAGCFA